MLSGTGKSGAVLLALLSALLVATAHSEPTAEQEALEATRLFENGRFDEAQAIVSRLRAEKTPNLQVIFLSGALHVVHGRYEDAAAEFRLVLARDPSLIRPRLELARALFMARDYEAARYHFEQTLASPLPDPVRSKVLNFLTLIRERLPSFTFSFDIVSDSNPKQATQSKTVEIGGILFRLNNDARAQEAQGVLVAGQGKVPLPGDPSWFARGYIEHFDYETGEFDSSYSQLLGGKHINFGANRLDIEGGWHLASYAGQALYEGSIWRVSDFIRLRPTVGLTLTVDSKNLRYRDFAFLTGWQHTVSAEIRYALDPQSSFAGGVSYICGTAEEPAYAFCGNMLNARHSREWKGGWIGSVSYQYARYRFDDSDPFFDVTRSEYENRAELGIANRYLSYRKFSPRLTVGAVERTSNIELYSFRRYFVRVGIVTEF